MIYIILLGCIPIGLGLFLLGKWRGRNEVIETVDLSLGKTYRIFDRGQLTGVMVLGSYDHNLVRNDRARMVLYLEDLSSAMAARRIPRGESR